MAIGFNYQDFVEHFHALGIVFGQNVSCHAALFSFGKCNAVDAVEALKSVVGENATIAAPAYHFDERPFDICSSSFSGIGKFSQVLFAEEGAVRSRCPVHSHIALGPKAKELLGNDPHYSFGPNSDFDWFLTNNFDLVLLGCSFNNGATFLHHIEALMQVPYRKWISSPKKYLYKGQVKLMDFKYFARIDASLEENFDLLIEKMRDDINIVKTPFGASYRIPLGRLTTLVKEVLQEDPYSLVKKNKDNE